MDDLEDVERRPLLRRPYVVEILKENHQVCLMKESKSFHLPHRRRMIFEEEMSVDCYYYGCHDDCCCFDFAVEERDLYLYDGLEHVVVVVAAAAFDADVVEEQRDGCFEWDAVV